MIRLQKYILQKINLASDCIKFYKFYKYLFMERGENPLQMKTKLEELKLLALNKSQELPFLAVSKT